MIEKQIIPDIGKVFPKGTDMLETMFRSQVSFHDRLHMGKFYLLGPNEVLLARSARNIMMEAAELMDELNWKEWKSTKKDVDWEQVKYEVADLMAFLMNACRESGMTAEDLFQYYMRKAEVNVKRQEASY